MKIKFPLLLTLPIVFGLGCGFLFLLLPTLLNRYLLPQLMAELPFPHKELTMYAITPWRASGTMSLTNAKQPGLSIPRFEIYYTVGSLLRGTISGLLLDSASLDIDIQNGRPIIRGLSGEKTPNTPNSPSPAIALPLAIDAVTLKNCRITLHQKRQKDRNINLNGQLDLGFRTHSEYGQQLTSVVGRLASKGDLELQGTFDLHAADNRFKATANVSVLRFTQDQLAIATTATDPPISLQISGNLNKARYTLGNLVLSKPEQLTVAVKGEIQATKGAFQGTATLIPARTKSAVAIDFTGTRGQTTTSIDFALTGKPFTLAEASFGPVKAEGKISIKGASTSARLSGRLAEINLKKWQTRLINVSFELPLHVPAKNGDAGFVTIDQLRYQDNNSGALQATIAQTSSGLAISSTVSTPYAPGLQLLCDGTAAMSGDITANCRIPATKIDSATFPSSLSLPPELSLTGTLAATGSLHIKDTLPEGTLTAEIHQGTISQGKNQLSDIEIAMVFPRLPLLQSAPSQLCTIGSAQFGKIQLADGRIHFRIEDEQSIFIEKIQMDWCGGKVETGSLLLAQKMQELAATLYCDRIGFTELMAQLGIDKAEGEGALNGRLPMVISRKRVQFDDGFLFSTPGNGGIVRFQDTRQLRQGIPNIDQSSYLDYSMQALENFAYNWTKLSFNSDEDDLLIAMQLDGKPAEPLPFGYKDGQIVPRTTGTGLQHPIRLDVNFRLPVNDLLHYGTGIQTMMEKM